MFVFWYCHKRGKEVRLAKEAEGIAVAEEGESGAEDTVEEGEDDEVDDEKDEIGEGKFEEMQNYQAMLKDVEAKANDLSQPTPPALPGERPPATEVKEVEKSGNT